VARAPVAAVIGTVQTRLVPLHAPLQERSFQPFAGVAVSLTGANDGNAAEHRGRHVMPACALRTVPRPETATASRKAAGANCAVTAAPGVTLSEQVEAPVHAPVQRTSFDPALGVAVRARRWPLFQVVVQLAAQTRPGTSDDTEPGPATFTDSGAWLSSRTSQAESCVSVQLPECP
jgi:hypothetical protein